MFAKLASVGFIALRLFFFGVAALGHFYLINKRHKISLGITGFIADAIGAQTPAR